MPEREPGTKPRRDAHTAQLPWRSNTNKAKYSTTESLDVREREMGKHFDSAIELCLMCRRLNSHIKRKDERLKLIKTHSL